MLSVKSIDCWQIHLNSFYDSLDLTISILYLPQLIGLALGLSEDELQLKSNFAFTMPLQEKLRTGAHELAMAS